MSYLIHEHYDYNDSYWVFTDSNDATNFFKEHINKLIIENLINQEVYKEIYGNLHVDEINQKVKEDIENNYFENKVIVYEGYVIITRLNDEGHGIIS